jgi:predicted transcriptional regulator
LLKRTRLEVRSDILRVAKNGAGKTRIVYGAYLSFDIAKKHLSALIADGRLIHEGNRYFTTSRGLEYIAHVEAVS